MHGPNAICGIYPQIETNSVQRRPLKCISSSEFLRHGGEPQPERVCHEAIFHLVRPSSTGQGGAAGRPYQSEGYCG
jgi:hypothetical protein